MTKQEFEAIYSNAVYWDGKAKGFKSNPDSNFTKDLNALIKEAQREAWEGALKERFSWIQTKSFEDWHKQQEK